MTTTPDALPTYFLSHGGGPWPYMTGPFREAMRPLEVSLLQMRRELGDRPRAALVISGHWEEKGFAISSGARPGMVYDYHGFPEALYRIRYEAPGSPTLAARVQALLAGRGHPARLDADRGFDHGTFSVMKVLYPEADLPVVQLSLDAGLDPGLHLEMGRALAPLRHEGVLIIGSGLSFHNLRIFGSTEGHAPSRRFDGWLQETVLHSAPQERERRLLAWTSAPSARIAHPREDHLLPLMAVVGAAWDEPATRTYHQQDLLGGLTVSSFRFGALPAAAA